MLSETVLPFLLEAFVGVGQYCDVDPVSGDVIVTGRSPKSIQHEIYRVNPFTGKIALIAKVGDGSGQSRGGSPCITL